MDEIVQVCMTVAIAEGTDVIVMGVSRVMLVNIA